MKRFPIPVLSPSDPLPDPRGALPDGLLAVGGGLSVERLREAYAAGAFPWSADPVTWWSPHPRAVIELDSGLRIPRRLQRTLRQGRFKVTFDRDFRAVIEACAAPRPGPDAGESWIHPKIIDAYVRLHEVGHAHSVEVWLGADLVGGVYGVAAGGAFAGESMFHRASDASKVALVRLVERLRERGFVLFDAQVANPFTLQMGAVEIARDEFLTRLAAAQQIEPVF